MTLRTMLLDELEKNLAGENLDQSNTSADMEFCRLFIRTKLVCKDFTPKYSGSYVVFSQLNSLSQKECNFLPLGYVILISFYLHH